MKIIGDNIFGVKVKVDDEIKCPQCEYQGVGERRRKGYLTLEIFLYLWFFFPGIFYTIWRSSNKIIRCPSCKWEHVRQISHASVD